MVVLNFRKFNGHNVPMAEISVTKHILQPQATRHSRQPPANDRRWDVREVVAFHLKLLSRRLAASECQR